MKELAKQYDPSQVEDRIYQFWLDGGYFHTKADPDKKPYTIVMPPPNVTGQLHMGHAVDNTCLLYTSAYGDPSAAQRHFAQLNKCTTVYLRLFRSGTPIQRLAVAA